MKKSYMFFTLLLMLSFFVEPVNAFPLFAKPEPSEPQTKKVPIIMYHVISKNQRELGKHGISPEEMESDLQYLAENRYETVVMADLIRFVAGKKELPEKPIVLTFDDGRNSDYDYLLPLLEKYDMKAVLSVVGEFTDVFSAVSYNNKPHLTWSQIEELNSSKRVEFQSHSYHFHGDIGCGKRKGESKDIYKARLIADLSKLQLTLTKKIGRAPTTFTYPLGIMSETLDEVLKELNFQASLSCTEGINNVIQGDSEGLFRLKRVNRRHGQSISVILKKWED